LRIAKNAPRFFSRAPRECFVSALLQRIVSPKRRRRPRRTEAGDLFVPPSPTSKNFALCLGGPRDEALRDPRAREADRDARQTVRADANRPSFDVVDDLRAELLVAGGAPDVSERRTNPNLDDIAADPGKALAVEVEALKALLVKHQIVGQALLTSLLAATSNGHADEARWVTAEEAASLLGMKARWLRDHQDEFVIDRPGNGRLVRFRAVGNDLVRRDD
jgi:hypothetical protein